jgi:hypothetical protein
MSDYNLMIINDFITYDTFQEQFKKQVSVSDLDLLSDSDKKYFEYRKLNFQRSSRLEKTFEPKDETKILFAQIKTRQTWVVITESWCGDSAQNLPIIAKLAHLNNKINFKIVLRDSNLDFMDLYLTDGGRSIPKLIVFDENNDELFQWGPRPKIAKNLFIRLKNEGMEKSEINKELHLWYGRDKGKEVENEIILSLKQILEGYTIK